MISDFTLIGAETYRIVGKKPRTKIYKLPYIDKQGRQQPLKEIKQTNRGYWINYDNGEKRFVSVSRLRSDSANLLKRERMIITAKEKGMPF